MPENVYECAYVCGSEVIKTSLIDLSALKMLFCMCAWKQVCFCVSVALCAKFICSVVWIILHILYVCVCGYVLYVCVYACVRMYVLCVVNMCVYDCCNANKR